MSNEKKIKSQIEETIKKSIKGYFSTSRSRTYHPLDEIFPKERKIHSLIQGLATSMGTQLWEPLATAIAKTNGYQIIDKTKINTKVPKLPKEIIHKISDFKEKKRKDNSKTHQDFFKELKDFIKEEKINKKKLVIEPKIPKGEGVDVYLKKNNIEYLIDIKTVQINAGSGPKFSDNLLHWYAYRALQNPNINLECFIGFPYNPHIPHDFWLKEGGKVNPLIHSVEALVADEFWDLLSGLEGTTQVIFDVFKKLGSQNFGNQFNHIFLAK